MGTKESEVRAFEGSCQTRTIWSKQNSASSDGMSRGAKLPASPVSPPHCCRPTLLSSFFRKLRGREDPRCPNCCPSLAKRPKMSVPELPPVEAPEEEVEEEVKITAEEMANMAVSNRPHTPSSARPLPNNGLLFLLGQDGQI